MILDNFPKILWINLDKSLDRRFRMEKILNLYKLQNERISAIDGTNFITNNVHAHCITNKKLTLAENACSCSHLNAIKYFVDKLEDDKIVIFEDDVSFEFLPLIPFNWSEFVEKIPNNFGVVQLAICRLDGDVDNILVKTDPSKRYYCSAAYMITRQAAKEILSKYYDTKIDKFVLKGKQNATADSIISNSICTYSIPIFSYNTDESTIHPHHIPVHIRSKTQQYNMWKHFSQNFSLTDKSNYDAYFANYHN